MTLRRRVAGRRCTRRRGLTLGRGSVIMAITHIADMGVPLFTLIHPVTPFRGYRDIDAWGSGQFAAPRSKRGQDGATRRYEHKGVDCLADPGDRAVWTCEAEVIRIGRAYPDEAPNKADPSDLGSIHLRGRGELRPLRIKLLYVAPAPDVVVGRRGLPGDVLGVAQDRAAYARAQNPARGPMMNHVHIELYWEAPGKESVLLNPSHYIAGPK